jgi:hypothetical protein
MRTQRQREDIPQVTKREQFVEKKCDGEFLDELLKHYRGRENGACLIQEELEALHRSAIKLASEIERAGAQQRYVFSGRSLNQVALPLDMFATRIRSEAANLKKAGQMVSRLRIRRYTRGEVINMIYKYCLYATQGDVTAKDVADLLNEATSEVSDGNKPVTEEAVRQAVKHHKQSADDEWLYAHNLAGAAMRRDKDLDLIRRKLRENDAYKA